jgi:hypothetical protein
MPRRSGLVVAAALACSVLFSVSSQASTIPITLTENMGQNGPSFFTDTVAFTLPTGFTDAALNISLYQADDRSVLELNGTQISNTGIFGPGQGFFFFSDGGPNLPYTFINGNNGPTFATLPVSPFIAGLNTLVFLVDNTNAGIQGSASGGPTQVIFDGTVTFTAAVPEPSTWAMLILGFCGIGFMAYRRKHGEPSCRLA